jgi:putative protease
VHGLLRPLPALGYINKRDPNQGTCTNACRWEYNVQEGKEDDVGNIVHKHEPIPVKNVEPTLGIGAPTDQVFMIEEAKRPGEYMTAFEDEHGTYIMNSKDLRAIAHVERLTQMGVHSLKIEGRTKSFYYCARTAQVYRKAIDDAAAGKPFDDQPAGNAGRAGPPRLHRRLPASSYP